MQHRSKLDELAHQLLEHEVLDRGDLDRILADLPRLDRRSASPGLRIAASDPAPPAAPDA